MISTLELKQFRGLEHIKFENLGRANLIIGGNNTGKTSILEALVLLHGNGLQFRNLPKTFREQPQSDTTDDHGFWKMLVREEQITGFKLATDDSVITGQPTENESPYPGQNHQFCRSNGSGDTQFSLALHSLHGEKIPFQINDHNLSVLSTKQTPPEIISELFNQIAPLKKWGRVTHFNNFILNSIRRLTSISPTSTSSLSSQAPSTPSLIPKKQIAPRLLRYLSSLSAMPYL
jgi:AAA ATPase domain